MSSNRHVLLVIGASIVALVLGGAVLVWPSYRQTRALREEIAQLEVRITALPETTAQVEALAERVAGARRIVAADLKQIPESADMASVIRKLSLPVDKMTVHDQTFTAGAAASAINGDPEVTTMAMPLTVEMQANFDSVFAMIRAAESMNRLVRVSSVRVLCKRELDEEPPVLNASVGLEAIYEPEVVQEGQ